MSFGLPSAVVLISFVLKITSSGFVTAQICPYPDGIYVVQEDCTSFLRCEGGKSQVVPCPRNLSFNPHKLTCDYNTEDNCITKTGPPAHAGEPPETDEHSCPDEGSSIQPSSNSCSEYYRCFNGTAYKEICPDGLLMNKQTLTCDFADEVPCDVFRQRKLLQAEDEIYDDFEEDEPEEGVTVSSVSEGEEPNGVPERGDSVNAGGSEEETLDLLENSSVNVDKNEDVSDNPENSDSVNAGKNEDVSFTDMLLPTATSLKNTFETTTETLLLTTKMQSSMAELTSNKAVESSANALPTTVEADKSDNPSLQTEKYPVSSTLSYDKTFNSSPNPTSSSTTIAIQAESKGTDSLSSQKELRYSTTMKPNVNAQTNKSTGENLVSENKFVTTKQDDATESSAITSEEFKTETKAVTTTYSPNNTQDASEYVQMTYTTESMLTSTQTQTTEVPNDDVSKSLNANDDSYDIVSDAETTSETLTMRATNTTVKPSSNATSESAFYSTAKPTTVPSTTFNDTIKSFTASGTYKVNITTEKPAESISTEYSLNYASETKELSSNVTEQNKMSTNEYTSNTDVFQTTIMTQTNLFSADTHSSVETSSIKKENSSEELDTERTPNESVISTDSENKNKTLLAFTTESSQQTTFRYKSTATVDFPVSSTALNPISESIYGKLENETFEDESMDKIATTKPTTEPPLSMTSTDQQSNDISTNVSPTTSDKLSVSVVTPVRKDTELTESTTAIKENESATTSIEPQEKRTEVTKVTEYSSIRNDVKDELSSTTTERQLRSEIIVATDTQTNSFETTVTNEQATDVKTTEIGEYTKNIETTTNKYNNSAQTTLSEKSTVEPTTTNNETNNLVINDTDNQTSYTLYSDIATTPMSEQKDSVTTSKIDDKTSSMETIKDYEQTTRTQGTKTDDQKNNTEIATYDMQVTNRKTTMPDLQSLATTLRANQASSLETGDVTKQTINVDEFKSDVQTTPIGEQNDSIATLLIDKQTSHVKTTLTYDPTTKEVLTSFDANSISGDLSEVPTPKTMEYFRTVAATTSNEDTLSKNSTTSKQVYNKEVTETEKQYNDVSTASTNALSDSKFTTGTYIKESSSNIMTTEKRENNIQTTSVEEIPLRVSTRATEDYSNVTQTMTVKEHTDNFQTTAIQYSSNEEGVTTEKDNSFMTSSKTDEQLIPIEKTTDDTRQKISSADYIETTITVGKLSDVSYTATEKSQTTDETIRDELEDQRLSSVSTIITDEELNTMGVNKTEKELLNVPSTIEKELITIISETKEMPATLPTRNEDVTDIKIPTTEEKSGTTVTKKTRDYLSSVVTPTAGKMDIAVTDYEIENETAVPTEIEQMSSSSATENMLSSSESTIKEQIDDLVTVKIDQDISNLTALTTADELAFVTTQLIPVVTTEKYKSKVYTTVDEKYTTSAEYALKTDKFAANVDSTASEDSTESIVMTKESNYGSTTETDDLQNNDVTTSKQHLKHTTTTEKNLDIVSSTTEKPFSNTDSFSTEEYTSNKENAIIENVITVDTTRTEAFFTDTDNSTTEEPPLTTAKESSRLKTTEIFEHLSTIKTVTQNYSSSTDSSPIELYSNNIFSPNREYASILPPTTAEDQLSSLSETTDVEEVSSLKTVANTNQTSNTETITNGANSYTLTTDKELRTVIDARDENISFSTTEDPKGMENVKTVQYLADNYTSTGEKYPSTNDPTTMKENPISINAITTEAPRRIDTIPTDKYPSSTDPTIMKENPTSIDVITTEEYPSRIDTIPTEKYPNSIKPITTITNPSTTQTIITSISNKDQDTDNYPKNIDTITDPTATEENPTSINTISIEEYSSRRDNIPTEIYPKSNMPIITKTNPSATETITTSISNNDINTDKYPKNIDAITTKKYASIDTIATEEYPSRIAAISTEKYLINNDPITTKAYPSSVDSITTSSSVGETNTFSTGKQTTINYMSTKDPASFYSITTETVSNNLDAITTETFSSNLNVIITEKDSSNLDALTTEKFSSNLDAIITEKYSSNLGAITAEKYSNNLDAITTEKYSNNLDAITTEKYSSSLDDITTEEYASSSTTTVKNNNSEIFSETGSYSTGTFTSITLKDPSIVQTTVEDKEIKHPSVTNFDKYPGTEDFISTEEHLSSTNTVTTKREDSNEDVTTELYSSNITTTGPINYTPSSETTTNIELDFIVSSSTARDQSTSTLSDDKLNDEMTTIAEEYLTKKSTSLMEEQPIVIQTVATTRSPSSVYATTEKQYSTGMETTPVDEVINVVSENTREILGNTTYVIYIPNLSISTEKQQNASEITVTEEEFKEVSSAFESASDYVAESTSTSISPRGSRIENSTFDYSFLNKTQSTAISPTTEPVFLDDQNSDYCNNGDGIFPHSNNCSMFVRCFNGSPYFLSCPEGLYYNATKRTCDFNGECGFEPRVPSSRSLQVNCECDNCVYPDAEDCSKYYVCLNGSAYDMQCSDGLQFNLETLSCDYEGKVTCAESSEECPTSNGYVKDSDNCSRYFHCIGGIAYRKTCGSGQHFNEITKQCDEPCSAGCDSNTCMKASTLLPSPVCQDGDKFYPHPENCNAFYTCSNGRAVLAFCIDDEHFSPTARMCQEPCKALCDHSLDCFKTTEGTTNSTEVITTEKESSTSLESTTALTFTSPIVLTTEHKATEASSTSEMSSSNDARTNAITFTSEVANTETTIGTTSDIHSEYPFTPTTEQISFESTTISSICSMSDGFYPKPGDCNSFIQCSSGVPTEYKCDRHLHFSPRTLKCEYPCYAQCDPTIDCSSTESPDLPTHQPLSLCPKRDILPGKKCEQYINCTGDRPFTRRCPVGLHFNPTTRVCDWPINANCGKQGSYPDVDNNYKCPCDTCIFPSAENCVKYHLCIGYVAYASQCSEGLLFDKILNTCNRASKVKCEEDTTQLPTIPTPSITASTTEKAATTTTAEPYKCSTKEGYYQKSDDCGNFIQCANWRPYVMKCPSNLHFSMKTLRCEYPCDAKCDLSLACSNTSKSGTADKICVCLNCKVKDPESCTNYFECKNGKARKLFCHRGQTFDSERGVCDWAHKVKCHSQTCPKMNGLFPHRDNCRKFLHCANGIPYVNECHNNWEFDPVALRCSWPTGRCGSTTPPPSTLKPQTKALKDFECPKNFGVFRDEQNCSRFYHCSHGIAFAKECPEGLAFNPKSQTCDWKKNVKCDSNRQQHYYNQRRCRAYDRHTTCPQSRVNIPHSNCDMFFECSSGSACGKRCPVGLYFNSTTAVCDHPENVQCYKGKNEVYSLREFAKACYKTGEGYMNDPAMSHCFYRCHHEKVIRGCCPRNAVYNEKKDKCEIQHRKLFF